MNSKTIFLIMIFLGLSCFGVSQVWVVEWEKQMSTSKMGMFIDVIEDIKSEDPVFDYDLFLAKYRRRVK